MRQFRWRCKFCGTKNSPKRKQCRTCVAPVGRAEVTNQRMLSRGLFEGDD